MLKHKEALKAIEKNLSPELISHACQVAETAQKMARLYQENEEKAYMAGVLHDYAKEKSEADLLKIAADNDMLDEVFSEVPCLLHAPVGAFLAEKELGIDDEEILKAISNHTLGRTMMTNLEKIIFLADMIEPARSYPEVEKIRRLAAEDLDQAMLAGLDSTLKYCLKKKSIIHPRTILARNYFLMMLTHKF